MFVDLNCDLGEGAGNDAAIIPFITSANIACAAHAGSWEESRATIALARDYGVHIGAHPGHCDRHHFGRRELAIDPAQVFDECVAQIGGLVKLAIEERTTVRYVKPHGGLYHQANREETYADAVIEAAKMFNLIVVGLPGSRLQERSIGRCPFVAEGFADRRYLSDGTLVPRNQSNALIEDPHEAVLQVERLLKEQGMQTICVHGDNPRAVDFVKALREALERRAITLRSFAG